MVRLLDPGLLRTLIPIEYIREDKHMPTYDDENFDEDYESDDYNLGIDSDFGYDCSFADPGGRSSLRAESESNPRNLPCGNCGEPDRLTPKDVALHYQCDQCADRAEGRGGY
jgi:hypothetical protein